MTKATHNKHPIATATNLTPIDVASLSLEQMCLVESLFEAHDRAEKEGRTDGIICFDRDEHQKKLKAKQEEFERTGKVTTTLAGPSEEPLPSVTNVQPIDLSTLSLEEVCAAEVLHEAYERAEKEGLDTDDALLALSKADYQTKLKEKREEVKRTGKFTTTVPPGKFCMAEWED